MELLVASALGLLTACAAYLMLRGRTFPVVLGLVLLGYAVNAFIVVVGRLWVGVPPLVAGGAAGYADPLPQALVLTAIVIGFATTAYAIALAVAARAGTGTDHVDGAAQEPAAPEKGRDA
jgi:multicomponent K+:H+ antiporter subunit C